MPHSLISETFVFCYRWYSRNIDHCPVLRLSIVVSLSLSLSLSLSHSLSVSIQRHFSNTFASTCHYVLWVSWWIYLCFKTFRVTFETIKKKKKQKKREETSRMLRGCNEPFWKGDRGRKRVKDERRKFTGSFFDDASGQQCGK